MKILVSVDEADIDRAVDDTFRKLAREVRVPGFRPGKVPRRVLEARMGQGKLRQEAIRDLLPGYYEQAVHDAELDPIAAPEIDVTAGNDGGPLRFEAVLEVRPHVAIPGYKGLRVTAPSIEATDAEVDEQIDRLRAQDGKLSVVERQVKDGDFVTIDFAARREQDGEAGKRDRGRGDRDLVLDDFLYQVGTSVLVEGLDDLLLGAAAGDALEMDAEVGGFPVHVKVAVEQVQERLLPDVTDEWAREASGIETVADLREDIRSRIVSAKRSAALDVVRNRAVEALVELVQEEAPEPLVQEVIDRRLEELGSSLEAGGATLASYLQTTGETRDDVLSAMREGAVFAVKADLALRALAEAENVQADESQLDEEIARMARRMGTDEDAVRSVLAREDRLDALRWELRKSMAARWLCSHVEVVDEEGHAISYGDLEPEDEGEQITSSSPEGAEAEQESIADGRRDGGE